jgi:RNA polymerase sigma factor (sigma-70 family)
MENLRLLGRRPPAHEPATTQRESPRRDADLADLVRAAAAHDNAAWARLMQRFDRSLRRIAHGYRLHAADIDDVVQAAWTSLFTSIHRLENPACVGAWLATATRRECLRALQRRIHEQLTDDHAAIEDRDACELDAGLVAAERRRALAEALGRLPERHRRLMVLLATDSTTDYRRISEVLEMPVGSIGPIRQRCLTRLAGDTGLQARLAA